MILMNIVPSIISNRFASRYLLTNTEERSESCFLLGGSSEKKGGKKAFTQGRGAAVSVISEKSLRRIQKQTLIIWGEEDNFFSIEHGEAAAQIIPDAKLPRIKGAEHLSLMDQPEEFNKALLDFLMENIA